MTPGDERRAPAIVPAEWDSSFFGVRIGRLVPDADAVTDLDALARLDRSAFDCVWVDLDVDAAHLVHRWEDLGARVVDLRVELVAALDRVAGTTSAGVAAVTSWSPDDRDAVTRLAVEQSTWSRLTHDPRFAGGVERMYRGWVAHTFTGEHSALVWRDGGRVVGMLTRRIEGEVEWIELLDVDGACRGRGIGASLVAHAIADARAGGRREARVRTQLRNLSAIRTYERAGFTVDRIAFVLHWWTRPS